MAGDPKTKGVVANESTVDGLSAQANSPFARPVGNTGSLLQGLTSVSLYSVFWALVHGTWLVPVIWFFGRAVQQNLMASPAVSDTRSAAGVVIGGAAQPVVLSTVSQALLSTVLSAVFGVLAGVLIWRAWGGARGGDAGSRSWPGRLLRVPSVVPSLVASVAWVGWIGAQGWWPVAAEKRYGLWTVVVAHVFFNAPYVAQAALSALARLPFGLLQQAALLGAGRWRRWGLLIFPAILPSVVTAMAQVFAWSAGSFVLVMTLGGGPPVETLETAIYSELRWGDPHSRQLLEFCFWQVLFVGGASVAAQWAKNRQVEASEAFTGEAYSRTWRSRSGSRSEISSSSRAALTRTTVDHLFRLAGWGVALVALVPLLSLGEPVLRVARLLGRLPGSQQGESPSIELGFAGELLASAGASVVFAVLGGAALALLLAVYGLGVLHTQGAGLSGGSRPLSFVRFGLRSVHWWPAILSPMVIGTAVWQFLIEFADRPWLIGGLAPLALMVLTTLPWSARGFVAATGLDGRDLVGLRDRIRIARLLGGSQLSVLKAVVWPEWRGPLVSIALWATALLIGESTLPALFQGTDGPLGETPLLAQLVMKWMRRYEFEAAGLGAVVLFALSIGVLGIAAWVERRRAVVCR